MPRSEAIDGPCPEFRGPSESFLDVPPGSVPSIGLQLDTGESVEDRRQQRLLAVRDRVGGEVLERCASAIEVTHTCQAAAVGERRAPRRRDPPEDRLERKTFLDRRPPRPTGQALRQCLGGEALGERDRVANSPGDLDRGTGVGKRFDQVPPDEHQAPGDPLLDPAAERVVIARLGECLPEAVDAGRDIGGERLEAGLASEEHRAVAAGRRGCDERVEANRRARRLAGSECAVDLDEGPAMPSDCVVGRREAAGVVGEVGGGGRAAAAEGGPGAGFDDGGRGFVWHVDAEREMARPFLRVREEVAEAPVDVPPSRRTEQLVGD